MYKLIIIYTFFISILIGCSNNSVTEIINNTDNIFQQEYSEILPYNNYIYGGLESRDQYNQFFDTKLWDISQRETYKWITYSDLIYSYNVSVNSQGYNNSKLIITANKMDTTEVYNFYPNTDYSDITDVNENNTIMYFYYENDNTKIIKAFKCKIKNTSDGIFNQTFYNLDDLIDFGIFDRVSNSEMEKIDNIFQQEYSEIIPYNNYIYGGLESRDQYNQFFDTKLWDISQGETYKWITYSDLIYSYNVSVNSQGYNNSKLIISANKMDTTEVYNFYPNTDYSDITDVNENNTIMYFYYENDNTKIIKAFNCRVKKISGYIFTQTFYNLDDILNFIEI